MVEIIECQPANQKASVKYGTWISLYSLVEHVGTVRVNRGRMAQSIDIRYKIGLATIILLKFNRRLSWDN